MAALLVLDTESPRPRLAVLVLVILSGVYGGCSGWTSDAFLFFVMDADGRAGRPGLSLLLAARSWAFHCFFRSDSSFVRCSGTTRRPFLTASNKRILAVPLEREGGRP